MEVDSRPSPYVTLLFFKVSNMVSPYCLDESLTSVFKDLLSYSHCELICWEIYLISWKKKKTIKLVCCKEVVHCCLTCSSCPAQTNPLLGWRCVMESRGKVQAASLARWPCALSSQSELHWIHPQALGVPRPKDKQPEAFKVFCDAARNKQGKMFAFS